MRSYVVVTALAISMGRAAADTAPTQRGTWTGDVDYLATGAAMAVDNNADDAVDVLAQPASVTIAAAMLPTGAKLVKAYLYWGGSIADSNCTMASLFDDRVDFTRPGQTAPTEVVAAACYCADGGNATYDVQVCRADVTALIGAGSALLAGNYVVDKFAANLITASNTRNASFSVVLVYSAPGLPPRQITLRDGAFTLENSSTIHSTALGGLGASSPARGDLTWYVLDGDNSSPGGETVTVAGSPGTASQLLSDAVNPAVNPMNHSINTVSPARSDTIGIDSDRFSIATALTASDTTVDVTYVAGGDKYWFAYDILGVDIAMALLARTSSKTSTLLVDADGNGAPTPGDTVRYTIRLENTGSAPAVAAVSDAIPAQVTSWSLVSAGGGTNASTATSLRVNAIAVPVGGSASVVFDAVLGDVPDKTVMTNSALFDARPAGDAGTLTAQPVVIRRDADGDSVFDSDDNCPDVANPTQVDTNMDGIGDACQGGRGCGDGVLDPGEDCDSSGVDTADCNAATCLTPACGDGHENAAAGEECESDPLCDPVTCTLEFSLGGGCEGCGTSRPHVPWLLALLTLCGLLRRARR